MKYEKAWADRIKRDLEGIDEKSFEKLDQALDSVLDSPNTKTKRVKCWKHNIRRIRIGDDYRLIIYVADATLTVYALAFLPRKEAYNKQNKKLIEKLAEQLMQLG